MCIRDRPGVVQRRASLALPSLHGATVGVGERVTPEFHPSSCLLYTSDAADDLLSVDPGGRRIIKTKNDRITH